MPVTHIQTPSLYMERVLEKAHAVIVEFETGPQEQPRNRGRIQKAYSLYRQLGSILSNDKGMKEVVALLVAWSAELGCIATLLDVDTEDSENEVNRGRKDALDRMIPVVQQHLVKLHTYYVDTIAKGESLARWVGEVIVNERESRQQLEQRFGDLEQHLGDLDLPE